MARPSKLSTMSLKDLISLQARVAEAIEHKKATDKTELKARMAKLAADAGFELGDLFDGRKGSRSGFKVAAKYRNPADPSQTWTGRGRRPLWMIAALKKGTKLDSLAI
jgi:DNA-binding protein H-NS